MLSLLCTRHSLPRITPRPFMLLAVCVLLLAAPFALLSPGQKAQAHANLVRSTPEPNSVLDRAPARVTIWFTEPLEPSLSEIRVFDSIGASVDNGDSQVDPSDATVLSVSLAPVPNGTYTVAWKNVSTVDGHPTRGSFPFAVGQPISGAIPDSSGQPLLPSPAEPVLRWLALLGVLAMVGGLTLDLLVTRPVFLTRAAPEMMRQLGATLASRTLLVMLAAAGLFLAASVAQLLLQVTVVHETSLPGAMGRPAMSVLADTRWGNLWLWRATLTLAFAAVVAAPLYLNTRPGLGPENSRFQCSIRIFALVIGGIILGTLSLTSHAAATPGIRTAALAADYLHLLAVAFWVGSLLHLALALPVVNRVLPSAHRRACLASLVPRFSVLGGLSLAVIIVTGVFGAWAQVTVFPALDTPYGVTLVAKVALILPLLLLAGVNFLWVRPRLGRHEDASQWLKRFVVGEALLAVLVLASVGVLTSLEPARQVASRQGVGAPDPVRLQDTAEGASMLLEVVPARVGPNDVTLALEDRFGQPLTNATEVSLRLSYLEADLGEAAASLESSSPGIYSLEGAQLSIAGHWQAGLVVRRPDAFDARTTFRFEVERAGAAGSAAISPSPETGTLLLGASLGVLGLLFLGMGLPLGGWFRPAGAGVMLPGLLGFLVGMGLLVSSQFGQPNTEPDAEMVRNPIPPDRASLEAGQATYGLVCQSCHGAAGLGDGPGGAGLEPPPADLTVHVPHHPDRELFRFIHDGIPETGMVPLGGQLTDEEIWHIINYIKALAE